MPHSVRGCRQFKNIGLQASVSVIPAKAGTQNPVAGNYGIAANGLWIPAKAGMTVNMTTFPRELYRILATGLKGGRLYLGNAPSKYDSNDSTIDA